MKFFKVLNVRTHIGGLNGKTSFDAVKDSLAMETVDIGVRIANADGSPFIRKGVNGAPDNLYFLIEPYTNCTELMVYPEESIEKRGPGRPAKEI